MALGFPQIVVENEFELVVDNLKSAELSRDLNSFEYFLTPYFDRDVTDYSIYEQAYINRFKGFYYIHFGKAKNIAGYQEIGRDCLSTANRLFHELGLIDEAIEAEISLGWSYYLAGDSSNFEAFLLNSLAQPFYSEETNFSIKVSLLIIYYSEKKIDKGFEIIRELQHKIDTCDNLRIVWQFYLNAGLIFRIAGKYHEAVNSYLKAVRVSRIIKNPRFEGQTINCLAYCYLASNQPVDALTYAQKAVEIFSSLNDVGLKANCLDTEALVLSRLGKFEDALNRIIKAIAYFRKSECYLDYAEALWNKIDILFKLRRKTEIFETFRELSNLAHNHLDLKFQLEYYKRFENMNSLFFGESFDEKRMEFEKSVIQPLLDAHGVTETARRLGFNHHQTLSKLVDRNPLINMKKKNPRSDKNDIREITIRQNFKITEHIDPQVAGFFQVNEKIAKHVFAQENELILLVIQDGRGRNGDLILMDSDGVTFVAELVVEEGKHHFVEILSGNNAQPNAEIFGRILGLASAADLQNEIIYFQKI